ncbi:unnamed protein product [Prorocentrum cordatum]|uniref:Uncharacterized protein n=1 Tax=Prorocentrum cordatum TaxID=2364126 RepID=A0ABN9UTG2_9DINO|nr:unnamed protein product [Polarella glacialis]CAK0903591.1 unnamed protein product [Polarella glacialis]
MANLPYVGEQPPGPALAWAEASSVAPALRQPSTPSMAHSCPCGMGHSRAVRGPGDLGPNQIRRPRALLPPQSSAPAALEDLPYMRRPNMRIPEPRMGSRTPRRHAAGAFAAPELLPQVELASGKAVGNQTVDIESTSVLSVESSMLPMACLWLHGNSAVAGEAERPFCTLLGHNRLSGDPCRREEDREEDLPSHGQSISRRPPVLDERGRAPRSPGPAGALRAPERGAPRAGSARSARG